MGDEDTMLQNDWPSGSTGFWPEPDAPESDGSGTVSLLEARPDTESNSAYRGVNNTVLRQGGLFPDAAEQAPDSPTSTVSAPRNPLANLPTNIGHIPLTSADPAEANYRPDPLEPSTNKFVNLFETASPGNTLMKSLVGTGAPATGQAKSGELLINSYEASTGQTDGSGDSAPRDSFVTNINGTLQGADQQKSMEEQRRQWEFDKGIDPEAKRNRIRPADGETPEDSGYNLHRIHPKEIVEKPHRAVDIKSRKGGPVVAASDGTVKSTGHEKNLGNHVVVDFEDGMRGVYGHTTPSVQPGQRVRKGDPVGNTDLSGATTGPHLHFEVHDPKTGKKINPEAYIPWRRE